MVVKEWRWCYVIGNAHMSRAMGRYLAPGRPVSCHGGEVTGLRRFIVGSVCGRTRETLGGGHASSMTYA
jgi:hypothetical protein